MHQRFSTCLGVSVLEEGQEEPLGVITGILVHPDTGKVEGFFVGQGKWLKDTALFLSSADIAHWGLYVRVRSADVLSPPEDRVRLVSLLEDGRTVLGQRIVTEGGSFIGICRDIQFETTTFLMEWMFPRKFLRWRRAIPVSSILQVRLDAIVVRDPAVTVKSKSMEVLHKLDVLTEAPVAQPMDA